jgi:hypothetical protein
VAKVGIKTMATELINCIIYTAQLLTGFRGRTHKQQLKIQHTAVFLLQQSAFCFHSCPLSSVNCNSCAYRYHARWYQRHVGISQPQGLSSFIVFFYNIFFLTKMDIQHIRYVRSRAEITKSFCQKISLQ